MNPNRNTKLKDCISVALLTVVAVTFILCLTDCRGTLATTSATERTEARTEYVLDVSRTMDSVYVHDSVYVYVTMERTEVTRWRTQWHTLTVHDTVREHTTDTIVMTETVEKVVTMPQKGGSTGWTVAFTLLAVIAVYMVIKHGLKIL